MSTNEMLAARSRKNSDPTAPEEPESSHHGEEEHGGLIHNLAKSVKETYNMMIGNYPDAMGRHRFDKVPDSRVFDEDRKDQVILEEMEETKRKREEAMKQKRDDKALDREKRMEAHEMDHQMDPESIHHEDNHGNLQREQVEKSIDHLFETARKVQGY